MHRKLRSQHVLRFFKVNKLINSFIEYIKLGNFFKVMSIKSNKFLTRHYNLFLAHFEMTTQGRKILKK